MTPHPTPAPQLPWEVVCPDGVVRKHGYRNEGDACCDADAFTRRGCALHAGPEELRGCPGGPHVVRLAKALVLS